MKMFRHILFALKMAYTNRTDPESMEVLARAFWNVLLLCGISVALLSVVFGVREMLAVFGTFSDRASSDNVQVQTLNRSKLDAAVSAFSVRKQKFEALYAATTTYADPSK